MRVCSWARRRPMPSTIRAADSACPAGRLPGLGPGCPRTASAGERPSSRTLTPEMNGEIDFEAEGLLAGLDGEARAERLRLLQYLHDDGVSLDELRTAVAAGAHMFLPAGRGVGGTPRDTARAVAPRAGLELAFLGALRP